MLPKASQLFPAELQTGACLYTNSSQNTFSASFLCRPSVFHSKVMVFPSNWTRFFVRSGVCTSEQPQNCMAQKHKHCPVAVKIRKSLTKILSCYQRADLEWGQGSEETRLPQKYIGAYSSGFLLRSLPTFCFWNCSVLVGAPKANSSHQEDLTEPGAVFQCKLSQPSQPCQQVKLDDKGKKTRWWHSAFS